MLQTLRVQQFVVLRPTVREFMPLASSASFPDASFIITLSLEQPNEILAKDHVVRESRYRSY